MRIINIDNGGTLTDFCVMEGNVVHRSKVLTTPYDLSKCFFDGIAKVSEKIYGAKDPARLLRETDYVRYSTTLGTNAIIERKGPRLGVIVDSQATVDELCAATAPRELFDAFVGSRIGTIDTRLADKDCEEAIIRAINDVASRGATRIVIGLRGSDVIAQERRLIRMVQRKFPSHLLGVVPVVTASGITDETDDNQRIWTALFNAYLHPAMERFLYGADHRLKAHKCSNPLLIFRNDGGTARVAKTTAIKTYSSGPRAGMEGVRALAEHYGLKRVISYDVGGTTTDIGLVEGGVIRSRSRGQVAGIPIAFPLADIASAGVGGSSVITLAERAIKVGPHSVGAAPGPACFGLGGKDVTITDVVLLAGILSPTTFFGGDLTLDEAKAREVVKSQIADPLGVGIEEAVQQIMQAWVDRVSLGISEYAAVDRDTTFIAFGGAGALLATALAERAGVTRIIIPGLAAVFSACGIGFSDLSHEYRNKLPQGQGAALNDLVDQLTERARRDMFAEGVNLDECECTWQVLSEKAGANFVVNDPRNIKLPKTMQGTEVSLGLKVVKKLDHYSFTPIGNETPSKAVSTGTRKIMVKPGDWREIPVYRLEDQPLGAAAVGPAIIEEEYFTGKIDEHWRFHVSSNRDVVIEKQ
jgi:N-methylhydantoinase A